MRTAVGVGFVLLSALAFASTPALVTLSYRAQIDAVSLVTWRCLIGAVVPAVLANRRRETRLDRRTHVRLLLLGGVLFGPQMLVYFSALHYLDTGITAALVYTYPAVVVALVAVRERKVPRATVGVLVIVALLGVATVSAADKASRVSALGVALALGTAVLYAGYVLASDLVLQVVPPLRASSIVLLGAGLSSLVVATTTRTVEVPVSAAGWTLLGVHGLVIIPVGMASYYAGLRRLGATRTSIIDTSQPALVAAIGAGFLGEHLSRMQWLGVALIVAAVVSLPLVRARAPRTPPLKQTSNYPCQQDPLSHLVRQRRQIMDRDKRDHFGV